MVVAMIYHRLRRQPGPVEVRLMRCRCKRTDDYENYAKSGTTKGPGRRRYDCGLSWRKVRTKTISVR